MMLQNWNMRNPTAIASLYAENGNIIVFDGRQHNGRSDIASVMAQIFADHPTAAYTGKVREVRFVSQSWPCCPNGRFLVFASNASNLVLADTNQVRDIFRVTLL